MKERAKVIGVGLNKTGTKTMGFFLEQWGYRHQSFDLEAFQLYRTGKIESLLAWMEGFDSLEDWPWPLIFREVDERFPEARFILTVRRDPDVWYRSLCKMAVRMGPLNKYERHIYGHAMPQGHREEHIRFYESHNRAVEDHFSDRPGKLLRLCWETGDDGATLAEFLGESAPEDPAIHLNRSMRVYGGDKLALAQANRVAFQTFWKTRYKVGRLARRVLAKAKGTRSP